MTMTATLPAIQMFWAEGSLSTMERLSIASFLHHGHPVHLYSYGDIGNVPEGTTRFDARTILPDTECFQLMGKFGFGSWAPFSNRFRFKLILEKGGIWCDTDIVCLRPLNFFTADSYFFATERQRDQHRPGDITFQVNNCAFAAPVGTQLMETCYRIAMSTDPDQHPWGHTGAHLLDVQVKTLGLQSHNLRPEIFCNIDYWEFYKIFLGCHLLTGFEHCIHFWNECWRRNFFDKNGSYEPHCLYERLKAHYLGRQGAADA